MKKILATKKVAPESNDTGCNTAVIPSISTHEARYFRSQLSSPRAKPVEDNMKHFSGIRLALLLAVALFMVACEKVTISDILADPTRYKDKKVGVVGTVTTSFGLMNMGGYEIQDDTGKIYVISNQGVPGKGQEVAVEGTVFTGAMVMGQSVGVAIREQRHKVR
jgi:hypothetical protein